MIVQNTNNFLAHITPLGSSSKLPNSFANLWQRLYRIILGIVVLGFILGMNKYTSMFFLLAAIYGTFLASSGLQMSYSSPLTNTSGIVSH